MANSNQQRVKVIEDDDENHHNHEQVLCHDHDFWNEAPEELLTEIFVRLVDSRLAARASTVCRRWHSLIRQNPRQFIELFKSHHHRHPDRYPREYSLPWAVVFHHYRHPDQYSPKYSLPNSPEYSLPNSPEYSFPWADRCSESNTSQACSDDWLFLHGKLPAKPFDFLPNSSNMQIKASCNDLFLLASHKKNDLYICNPITEQFVQLPAGPRVVKIAYAVIRTANTVRFKVVKVLFNRRHYDNIVRVAVFCSVSRKWETRSFPCPGVGEGYDIVTVDGILYWLSRLDQFETILVYLDLSKDKCGTFRIPWPKDTSIGAVLVSGGSHELRLLQIDTYNTERIVYLKVWRLDNNNNNLILVHDKKTLARPESLSGERSSPSFGGGSRSSTSFVGAFVHPTDGDLVLCVWGKNVFEYNLVDSTCKKIVELSRINPWSPLKPLFLMVGDSGGLDL